MNRDVEERDVFCHTCNKVVVARVRALAHGAPTAEIFSSVDSDEPILGSIAYELAFCVRCESVFLIRGRQIEVPSEYFTPTIREVIYPREREVLPEPVPASVRRAFESALICFRAGTYEPCAIMCRKSLEALCSALGETDTVLAVRIAKLSASGRIDQRLASWANELRLVGNDAAHDLEFEVSKEDAQDGLDFVEAILQNVFVLDHKFSRLKARRLAQGR